MAAKSRVLSRQCYRGVLARELLPGPRAGGCYCQGVTQQLQGRVLSGCCGAIAGLLGCAHETRSQAIAGVLGRELSARELSARCCRQRAAATAGSCRHAGQEQGVVRGLLPGCRRKSAVQGVVCPNRVLSGSRCLSA